MLAMQYAIALPASFDMATIQRRIADRAHLLDGLAGLDFKAWLYALRGDHGADHRYAPFYLWRDAAAMTAFLLGPGFATLAADFGRPPVRTWTPLYTALAPSVRDARFATLDTARVPAAAALDAVAATSRTGAAHDLAAGAVAAVDALDTRDWTLARFRLWPARPAAADRELYAVGHVSIGSPRP